MRGRGIDPRSAHDAASHLIELFEIFGEGEVLGEGPEGTDWLVQSQELLRAMLTLASVGSYFDIPSKDLIPDPDAVKAVFAKRNQIVHEMDFDSATGDRRQRQSTDMEADTQELFTIADRFLMRVADRLSPLAHDAPAE